MARNYIFRGYRLDDIDCFSSKLEEASWDEVEELSVEETNAKYPTDRIIIYCFNVSGNGLGWRQLEVTDQEKVNEILKHWYDANELMEDTERAICKILF